MQDIVYNFSRILVSLSLCIGLAEFVNFKNEILKYLPENKKKAFKVFIVMLPLSILVSLLVPSLTFTILLCLLLGAYVFDGTFNGGSDYMNFLIILSLSIYSITESELIQKICLMYIGAQAALSYAVAGFAKLLKSNWRSGESLFNIINKSHYLIPSSVKLFFKKDSLLIKFLSWFVIAIEIGIFLGFFNLKIGILLVICFLTFHLVNVIMLGLNRFLFAWLAAYPSLIYCFYLAQ